MALESEIYVCASEVKECSGSEKSSAEPTRICAIKEIKAPRDLTGLPVCFSLIHLIPGTTQTLPGSVLVKYLFPLHLLIARFVLKQFCSEWFWACSNILVCIFVEVAVSVLITSALSSADKLNYLSEYWVAAFLRFCWLRASHCWRRVRRTSKMSWAPSVYPELSVSVVTSLPGLENALSISAEILQRIINQQILRVLEFY